MTDAAFGLHFFLEVNMRDITVRKTLTLSAIGILCLIFGVVYGIMTKDRLLIIMSAVICCINLYKVVELRKIEKDNKYVILTGKCVGGEYKMVGKYRTFQIQNGDDVFEISVPKSVKLKRNEEYNLFFKKTLSEPDIYGGWLKNKILSENFLGFEKITQEGGEK